ncbi:filamin-binding LIM protein 1 [Pelobates fuscus]|uniref:filamin-binding LIM protein 1 n=1 Tax=Pelobates fuscus TaxID=191477 RepID=UPI002FE43C16
MSGKRMVSSVQIMLAPPWRAEISRKTQSHTHEQHVQQLPPTPSPPPLEPLQDQSWAEHADFQNGGPSFRPIFLDDMPSTDDFLGSDLPPPPPSPPVLPKTPKQFLRDSFPAYSAPFPEPTAPVSMNAQMEVPRAPLLDSSVQDRLSLELRKLDLAPTPSVQKPSAGNPIELNKSKNVPVSHTQQKTERSASDKQNQNGHTMKQDNEGSDICAFCHKAILPNVAAIEAMKKQYHASCFTCRKCHRLLAGQLYYQKDGQPICDHCYKETLEKCAKCQALITHHIVRAMGNGYHPECFTCVVCNRMIADESFAVDEYNDVYCAKDYYRKYAPICSVCDKPIIPRDDVDSYKIECLGRNFHENCYRCEKCHITLSLEPTESGCYPLKGHIMCKPCHLSWTDQL